MLLQLKEEQRLKEEERTLRVAAEKKLEEERRLRLKETRRADAEKERADANIAACETPRKGGKEVASLSPQTDERSRKSSNDSKRFSEVKVAADAEVEAAKAETARVKKENLEEARKRKAAEAKNESLAKKAREAVEARAEKASLLEAERRTVKEQAKAIAAAKAAQATADAEKAKAEAEKAVAVEAERAAMAERAKAEQRAEAAEERVANLKEALGIECHRGIPGSDDRKRGLPFLKSVISERPAANVATALAAGGYDFLKELLECSEFQPLIKETIEEIISKIQERWSPRLAVLIMSDLQLSRSQFDALRHYLSFEYDVTDDVYKKLNLYVNPKNVREKIDFPTLAARKPREADRDMLYGLCGVESSEDGMVSYIKDQRGAVSKMVADHWDAISSDVKEGRRPLLVAGFGDATGGWRGASITHFETGIASWESKDIKQGSKLNLLPTALGEGGDDADNLRLRFQPVADGYNSLADGTPLEVNLPSGRRSVPMGFTFCGDLQIHKAILGMSKFTSAVFCCCDHDTTGMFVICSVPASSWVEVLAFYARSGCVIKTPETVCELNHYSYEVLMGRPFKRFKCSQPGCDYEAKTEADWRRDMKAHALLDTKPRKEADLVHGRGHKRHRKFLAPMLKHTPPLRMSADILHVCDINLFTMYMEATIFCYVVELDATGRAPIEAFFASKGIPAKIVKAADVGEMKDSLIGRDAKVLMEQAEEIIPALLCFVHTPKEEVQEAAAAVANAAADDDEAFDWDGDGEAEYEPESLEAKVAAHITGATVRRISASASKGALLAKMHSLGKTNMHSYSSRAELEAMRGEIEQSSVLAVCLGNQLLSFAAYRVGEPEGDRVVTYLFELHRDLEEEKAAGSGSLLFDEVEAEATAANESMLFTVAERNAGGRRFYSRKECWLDKSSPQNFGGRVGYLIMRKYPTNDESVAERDARFWDNYLAMRCSLRVFESDTDAYRQQRAVEVFNTSNQVMKDVKVLRPTLQSAIPHILRNIVPQQIVEMGDPLGRGCDQSEAIGANLKSTLHRRVRRVKLKGKWVDGKWVAEKTKTYTRRDASGGIDKQWTQKALQVSRVMQAFKAECVRERIVRDPGSAHLLQRKHHRLLKGGRASKAPTKEEKPEGREISEAYKARVREARAEGGEPPAA